MTCLLVTVHGPDQPGIVAAVTTVLAENECNLEDTSMTRLGGHFTMLMLVTTDRSITEADVPNLFSSLTNEGELAINVDFPDESGPKSGADQSGERWAISLYGADRRGIVAEMTTYLAGVGANIEDLSTRLTGNEIAPVYTMLLDITVPDSIEGGEIATELDRRATELGITCHARRVDVDTF